MHYRIMSVGLLVVTVNLRMDLTNAKRACCIFHMRLTLALMLSFSFMEWGDQVFATSTDEVVAYFRLLGVIEALASIFKVLVQPLVSLLGFLL